ncbi:MAG: hypothetical protein AB7F78_10320 [Hyphomicrobiaceae bacterium]
MTSRAFRPHMAFVATLAVMLPLSSAAAAVTLVNRDEKDHKLTVIEEQGAKSSEHMLKPSQVLEGICEKGCVIRLNDSEEDEYELEAGDKVSIEEGYLYYDEPEVQQGAGGAPQPAPAPAPAPAPQGTPPVKQ